MLAIRDLHVSIHARRQTLPAVSGVSFEIAEGEVLGLVGESGAGKSITGAAVIGLLPAGARLSSGEIHLAGLRLDTLSPARLRGVRGKRIGMVFQDPSTSLDPLLTVGGQLVETIQRISTWTRGGPAPAPSNCWRPPAFLMQRRGWAAIRTNFPAGCGNGWSSRWRSRASRNL